MRAWTVWATALAMGIAEIGCSAHGGRATAPAGGTATSWRYDVVVTPEARELRVDAWLPPGSLAELVVRRGAEPFVHDAEVEDEEGWHALRWRGVALYAPECTQGCHVRYRFDLARAASMLHDTDLAIAWGNVVEASPSVWLLRPTLARWGTRYRFHVSAPRSIAFVTGVFAAEDGAEGSYEADAANIGVAPYAAFGPVRRRHVAVVEGATIDMAIAPADYHVTDDALVGWATRSARTMARFLGCFPLERVMLLVVPARGDQVRHGETMGDGGAAIVVEVGEGVDQAALDADWILPHEMAHLAVPSVARQHHWIEEGLAVYMQPIARARAGELRPEDVWREFAIGMRKGIPSRGDWRLDGTPDWARTYWGGATFCLAADVEIRRRTGNRLGLEDALRGVLASGGSVAQVWEFRRLLETADGWVGTPVLASMHDDMLRNAWSVDLPRLLGDLGVIVHGDDVTLVDDAPLAAARRAITEPTASAAPDPVACRFTTPGRMAQR
jgi:hypothetical protein